MDLSKLIKIRGNKGKAKRVGRGVGSGKGGHTSGRGTKGQKARGKVPVAFEGTKTKKSFIKRLPLLRGRGKFKPWGDKPVVIKLGSLADWPKGTPVTTDNLVKRGWLKEAGQVKILGEGQIKQALQVEVKVSRSARKKIEAAGG